MGRSSHPAPDAFYNVRVLPARLARRAILAAAIASIPLAAVGPLAGCGREGDRSRPSPIASPATPAARPGPGSAPGRQTPGGGESELSFTPDPGLLPTIEITLTDSMVAGLVPPGSAGGWVEAKLRDGGGRLRGSGEASMDRTGTTRWRLYLRDAEGEDVLIQPGDRVRIAVHGDAPTPRGVEIAVPDVRLTFDRPAGTLSGEVIGPGAAGESPGAPGDPDGAAVTGTVEVDPPLSRVTRIDSAGRFALAFGAADALVGGTPVRVSVEAAPGGPRVHVARPVPYARVSLHPGDITGAMRPDADLSLELRGPGGGVEASARARADASGRFMAWLHAPDGRRVRPAAGKRVVVRDGETELAVDVAPLDGQWDFGGNRLSGAGLPGAKIDVVLWNPWYPGQTDTPATSVGADGAWTVRPAVPLHPGSHFYLTEHLADGDQLYYCYQIPMLYVEPGSAVVEVQALWEIGGGVFLMRGSDQRAVGGGRGGGPWSGNLTLVLRSPGDGGPGGTVAARPGDQLLFQVWYGDETMGTAVGQLDADLDRTTGRITGHAPPGARVGLARPEAPITGTFVTVGVDGSFTLDARGVIGDESAIEEALATETLEVFYTTEEGHNMRRRFTGARMTVDLGGREVTGQAMPGSSVTVTRQAAPPDTATAAADATGRFTATLGSGEAPFAAGDVVSLRANGASLPLTIEPLAAEIDIGGAALSGTAPPDALLDIAVHVGASEIPDRLSAFAGDNGRWSVDLRNPLSGLNVLDLDLIRRVEIVLRAGAVGQRLVLDR